MLRKGITHGNPVLLYIKAQLHQQAPSQSGVRSTTTEELPSAALPVGLCNWNDWIQRHFPSVGPQDCRLTKKNYGRERDTEDMSCCTLKGVYMKVTRTGGILIGPQWDGVKGLRMIEKKMHVWVLNIHNNSTQDSVHWYNQLLPNQNGSHCA